MKKKWSLLAIGGYNFAFVNRNKTEVLKVPTYLMDDFAERDKAQEPTEVPARAARVWNEINEDLAFRARESFPGWVAPYINGTQSSIAQISEALIEIYNKTGRVVLDPAITGNFFTTPEGNVYCVDIGFAVRFQRQAQIEVGGLKRSSSHASLEVLDNNDDDTDFLRRCVNQFEYEFPELTRLIKALCFLSIHCPYIDNISFIGHKPHLLQRLSKGFDSYMSKDKPWRIDIARTSVDQAWIQSRQRKEKSVPQELDESRQRIQYIKAKSLQRLRTHYSRLQKLNHYRLHDHIKSLMHDIDRARSIAYLECVFAKHVDSIDFIGSGFQDDVSIFWRYRSCLVDLHKLFEAQIPHAEVSVIRSIHRENSEFMKCLPIPERRRHFTVPEKELWLHCIQLINSYRKASSSSQTLFSASSRDKALNRKIGTILEEISCDTSIRNIKAIIRARLKTPLPHDLRRGMKRCLRWCDDMAMEEYELLAAEFPKI